MLATVVWARITCVMAQMNALALNLLAACTFVVGAAAHGIPFLPSASDAHGRQGIAQVVNRSARADEVLIVAVDDSGRRHGPLALFVEANGTARIDSDDLENGNANKGLFGGTGPGVGDGTGEAVQFDSSDLEQGNFAKDLAGGTCTGQGDWRLELTSDLDIEVLSYVRARDGLLTSIHDVVPSEGEGTWHRVILLFQRSFPIFSRGAAAAASNALGGPLAYNGVANTCGSPATSGYPLNIIALLLNRVAPCSWVNRWEHPHFRVLFATARHPCRRRTRRQVSWK